MQIMRSMRVFIPHQITRWCLKLLKRLPAADQFTRHVLIHHLDESLESAYEMFCWTETAFVRFRMMSRTPLTGGTGILLLLDSSAAFDTGTFHSAF